MAKANIYFNNNQRSIEYIYCDINVGLSKFTAINR